MLVSYGRIMYLKQTMTKKLSSPTKNLSSQHNLKDCHHKTCYRTSSKYNKLAFGMAPGSRMLFSSQITLFKKIREGL